MNITKLTICALALALTVSTGAWSATEPVFMSPEWAELACDAWNEQEELLENLTKWMENDLDRGYKIIQIYRKDCEDSGRVELRLQPEEGKTKCVSGGAAGTQELDKDADYVMFAMTERWQEMGAGNYGPMKGMMFGRLKFEGPKWEAMNNMGPFSSFLLLTGEVPSDPSVCPE